MVPGPGHAMLPRTPQNRTIISGLAKGWLPRALRFPALKQHNREEQSIKAGQRSSHPGSMAGGMFTITRCSPHRRYDNGQRSANSRAPVISETEYASAVAEFLAKRGITRCPTA